MKKITLTVSFLVILSAVFIFGSSVLAVSNSEEAFNQLEAAAGSSGANIAGSGATDPRMIVAIIIRASLAFVGIFFVVLIMYAGWLWMTAAGEEEKIGKAKKLILNGVIGLAIVLAAYSITLFIIKVVLGQTDPSCGVSGSSGGFSASIGNCGGGAGSPQHWYNGL